MRVLLLSRYTRQAASSRYRSYQYIPFLEQSGVTVTPAPLMGDDYVTGLQEGRERPGLGVLAALGRRLLDVLRSGRFDLVWLEREALPWMPPFCEWWLRRRGIPFIVDYDDAVFHQYDLHRSGAVRLLLGRKIDAVMRRAAVVVAGNEYLAARARRAGAARVEVLPTVIDLRRYRGRPHWSRPPVIGWIGSPTTAEYVNIVAGPLERVCRRHGARVRLIGAPPGSAPDLDVEYLPWSEETEVEMMLHFSLGIMPLPDTPWTRGKCGLKIIQYMGCRLPCVASLVGSNPSLVAHGETGFLVRTEQDWEDSLDLLLEDGALRERMGQAGRARAEELFSLERAAPRLLEILREALDASRGDRKCAG